jgi:hypothetical protein
MKLWNSQDVEINFGEWIRNKMPTPVEVLLLLLLYKDLGIEMQLMWDLKCTIMPVIIGATRKA